MNELLVAWYVLISCLWLGLMAVISHFYWRGRRSIESKIEHSYIEQMVQLRQILILLKAHQLDVEDADVNRPPPHLESGPPDPASGPVEDGRQGLPD